MRAVLQEIPQPSATEISLKITYLKFCSNLPGANELRWVASLPVLFDPTSSVCEQALSLSLFHVPNGFAYLGPLVASQNVSIKAYDWLI